MLACRLFQWLPFGTVAFRSHLFSAVCVSLSCSVLFIFLSKILQETYRKKDVRSIAAAAIASLACVLTPLIRSQAVITEVYGLFVIQFSLALLFLYELSRRPKMVLAPLVFLLALMLIHHRLSIFLFPIFAVLLIILLQKRFHTRWLSDSGHHSNIPKKTFLIQSGTFFLIPFLFMLYYPLRAFQDPAINWYDPETLYRFQQLIHGEQYSRILETGINLLVVNFNTGHVYTFFVFPFLCYSWLAIPAILGIIVLFRMNVWLAGFFAALFIMYQTFLLIYPVGDWFVFLIPALVLISIPLAFGLQKVIEPLSHRVQGVAFYLVLLLIGCLSFFPLFVKFDEPLGLISQTLPTNPQSFPENPFPLSFSSAKNYFHTVYDTSTADYATQVFQIVPTGTPILTGLFEQTADNELHPLLYQQIVEQKQPDSVIIGAGFLYLDWYRREMNRELNLDLEMRGDRLSLSREHWHENTWKNVAFPLLQRTPIVSTSHPLPQKWYSRCQIEQIGSINIDKSHVPFSYRRYIPFRYVYRLTMSPE